MKNRIVLGEGVVEWGSGFKYLAVQHGVFEGHYEGRKRTVLQVGKKYRLVAEMIPTSKPPSRGGSEGGGR